MLALLAEDKEEREKERREAAALLKVFSDLNTGPVAISSQGRVCCVCLWRVVVCTVCTVLCGACVACRVCYVVLSAPLGLTRD